MEVDTAPSRSFDLAPSTFPRFSAAEFETAAAEAARERGALETAAEAAALDHNELQSTACGAILAPTKLVPTAAGDPPSGSEAAESPIFDKSEFKAATKLQKVYRGHRTRRKLADSAVVAEELWWQLIDYARLSHSTISFFDNPKPETAVSRWNRVSLNASKVGQGLSKDALALKLAFQHWIEAIDPQHRYGHNLHFYYEEWCKSQAGQPFFYWLDIGDGRDVDLKECPRSLLRKQCIKYLGPLEREHYEYVPVQGKIVHKQTGELLDTNKGPEGTKWIFVMSTAKGLYAGQKKKGIFHHSSFLAGGTTIAAGRFTADEGVLKSIWAYSGHYKPSEENQSNFLSWLRENGVNLDEVEVRSSSNEDYYDDPHQTQLTNAIEAMRISKPPQLKIPPQIAKDKSTEQTIISQAGEKGPVNEEAKPNYRRTLSGGLQSPKAEVPEKEILERIESKRKSSSYQLGHQLSLKNWCTGAGPRIGCVTDYPVELRVRALELVDLSPRECTPIGSSRILSGLSPRPTRFPTLATSPVSASTMV